MQDPIECLTFDSQHFGTPAAYFQISNTSVWICKCSQFYIILDPQAAAGAIKMAQRLKYQFPVFDLAQQNVHLGLKPLLLCARVSSLKCADAMRERACLFMRENVPLDVCHSAHGEHIITKHSNTQRAHPPLRPVTCLWGLKRGVANEVRMCTHIEERRDIHSLALALLPN
jgi:hypothetical protein